jgi:hypothetical protein
MVCPRCPRRFLVPPGVAKAGRFEERKGGLGDRGGRGIFQRQRQRLVPTQAQGLAYDRTHSDFYGKWAMQRRAKGFVGRVGPIAFNLIYGWYKRQMKPGSEHNVAIQVGRIQTKTAETLSRSDG